MRADDDIVDFELIYMNPAGGRFLGRPPEALVGRTYRQLWPETVTDGTLQMYRQVVQQRVTTTRTVYYDRASVAGHFEFWVGPYGDGSWPGPAGWLTSCPTVHAAAAFCGVMPPLGRAPSALNPVAGSGHVDS